VVVIAFADTAELAVRLTLDDKFSRQLGRAQGSLGKFQAGVGRAGRGVGQLGAGLARAGSIGFVAVGAGLVGVTKAAVDFEDAFAGVVKTVNASPAELAVLRNELLNLSTTIPISAVELANLAETAGALGIETAGIDEFVKTAALLGVTTNVSAQEAATSLGILANVLHILPEDFDNLGSALVNLGNQGASTEAQILDIAQRFGAAGKRFGLATDEILALAEATASFSGLAPEAAGSSLIRLLGTLTTVAGEGGDKLDILNKVAGTDFKKAMGKDASGALEQFLKGFAKLDKFEAAKVLKEIGLNGVFLNQLLGGLSQNTDGLAKSFDNAHAAFFDFNALQIEADKRFATTASKFAVLRGNILRAAIAMGDGFVPALGRAAEKLTAFLQLPATQGELAKLGRDIGAFIDGINWTEVMTGAREFASLLKDAGVAAINIVKALNTLPTEVKALGLGLIGLNKLSGGLVGAGLSNIIGGLAEPLVRNLAASIPLFGRAFVQPVFVTNMGAGLPGAPGGGAPPGLPPGVVVPAIGAAVFIDKAQLKSFNDSILSAVKSRGTLAKPGGTGPRATDAMAIHGPAIVANTAATAARVGAQGAQTAALRERLAERLTAVQQASVLGLGGVRNGIATVGLRVAGTTAALGTVAARISTQTAATSAVKTAVGTVRSAVGVIPGAIARNPPRVAVTANTYVTTNVSVRDLGINSSRKSKFGYSHL
jgi:TP901 family phage tail tape measure protein